MKEICLWRFKTALEDGTKFYLQKELMTDTKSIQNQENSFA